MAPSVRRKLLKKSESKYLMLWLEDKGPMVFTARVGNDPERKLEELRLHTDGQALR